MELFFETPTQSLSAIRNEAIEECAKYLDGNHYLEIGVSPSEAIRNLKTDPQLKFPKSKSPN